MLLGGFSAEYCPLARSLTHWHLCHRLWSKIRRGGVTYKPAAVDPLTR